MSVWKLLEEYPRKQYRHLIGLMSGTSLDGVDAALVRISGSGRATRVELLAFITREYPEELRQRVLAVSQGEGNAEEVSRLNVLTGQLFARAAKELLLRADLDFKGPVDAIASHGQTISHTPHARATFQIGESSVLAQEVGVPVVSDFRAADVTAGGQGAPLVPYADWCLLTDRHRHRAIQNIGGIGNVTFLPADARPSEVLGFDTGPGNMLIDAAAAWATLGTERMDRNGSLAAQGTVLTDVLESLLNHPFLAQHPPKSAGREEFGQRFFDRLLEDLRKDDPWLHKFVPEDLVATLTAFTVLTVVDSYERFMPWMPEEVIIGGGGARNPTLMRLLGEKLNPIKVLTHEDVGFNSDAKEAVAFAVLANETLLGNPSNLPSVTGASRSTILGKVTLP